MIKYFKYILLLCLSTLVVSCNHNLSNRQERVLYGGCEGCYEPIYVRVHNVTTTDTVWMSFDINNFLNCFCPQNMSCESFKKKLEETIDDDFVIDVNDSVYKEQIDYHTVMYDSDIYRYYNHYGVDSLLEHYDLNKFENDEFSRIDYIGLLLWTHDILIGQNDEDREWYYTR